VRGTPAITRFYEGSKGIRPRHRFGGPQARQDGGRADMAFFEEVVKGCCVAEHGGEVAMKSLGQSAGGRRSATRSSDGVVWFSRTHRQADNAGAGANPRLHESDGALALGYMCAA